MSMKNFLNNALVTVVSTGGAGAASATPTKATILDMLGYECVAFIAVMGDVVNLSEVALKAAQGDTNDTAAMTLITGASAGATATATSFDDKAIILDIIKPTKRYVEAQIFHVTQNAPFDTILAVQYNARSKPVTQPASVVATDQV
jgi:hypothetical protein